MHLGPEDNMPGQYTERTIHIWMEAGLHRRVRIRGAQFDTRIQDFVVRLLDREASDDAPRRPTKNHAAPGKR